METSSRSRSATEARPAQSLLALGLAAARANALPALLLWLVASAVVASYYLWPAAQPVFDQITAWRETYGFFYSMVSTALFAALIPYLMQALQKGDAPKRWGLGYLVYLLVFWALKGVEVDLLYRSQAWLFGDGRDAGTLAAKVFVDQIFYVPLWAAPSLVVGMLFAQGGFSWKHLRHHHLRSGWYRRLILPVVIPNWLVWVPAVVLIYLLPTVLQLPMQNLVLCLWVLMVMFMTGQQERASVSERGPR